MLLKKESNPSSDEALMQQVCRGDQRAFAELYARYSRKLLYFMYRMLNRDKEKAEDLLQDVFMKIIERPEQFDPAKKFSTWVYTVAGNLCRNELRNQATRSRILEGSGMKDDHIQPASFHAHIDHKQFKAELQNVYEELNERERAIFVLRFQHDLPIKDIAEIIGCPEGTVKSGTYYLLKKITQKFPHYRPE